MKHSTLKALATSAWAGVDRATAAKFATAIAASASGPNGSPVLRNVATIIAKSLTDVGAESATTSSAPSPRASGPDTAGWQRALDMMKATPDNDKVTIEPAGAASPTTNDEGPTSTRQQLKGLLTGYYDTANIGRYTFTLMNGVQLGVGYPRNPGNIGGQFWIESIPPGVWHRLRDRGARLLDIWVSRKGQDLHVLVGDGPEGSPVLAATDLGR